MNRDFKAAVRLMFNDIQGTLVKTRGRIIVEI